MRMQVYIFSLIILSSLSQSQKACWGPDKGTQFVNAAAAYVAVHGAFVATDIYKAVKNRLETPNRSVAEIMSARKPNYEQMRAVQDSRNEYAKNVYNFLMKKNS